MSMDFEALPDVFDVEGLYPGKLPLLLTPFSVPFLEDKPQNPIIQTIQSRTTDAQARKDHVLPKELLLLSQQLLADRFQEEEEDDRGGVWEEAARLGRADEGRIASWDTLQSNDEGYAHAFKVTPFLSEQPIHVVAAARFYARPSLFDPNRRLWHISAAELIENLSSILLGCPSSIYVWDSSTDRFVVRESSQDEVNVFSLEGMDDIVSESYIRRFIIIGTLLRRLELLAHELRNLDLSSSAKPATTYAFAHALSAVIGYVQNEMSRRLSDIRKRGVSRLADFWLSFEDTQIALESIARLCGREFKQESKAYDSLLSHLPSELLSHIYHHLMEAHKRSGNRLSLAFGLMAYIMTVTSKPYLGDIAEQLGLQDTADILDSTKADSRYHANSDQRDDIVDQEEEEPDNYADEIVQSARESTAFPSFVSAPMGEAIIRAQRSIRILQVSQAPLSSSSHLRNVDSKGGSQLQWIWSESELRQSFDSNRRLDMATSEGDTCEFGALAVATEEPVNAARAYPDEIAKMFKAFDLEPGSLLANTSSARRNETFAVQKFLAEFPASLPAITPSIPLLAERILSPITKRANELSRASLRIFYETRSMDGSGVGILHFRTHVVLLRSYLLMMGSSFRERLLKALFSDKTPEEEQDERTRTRHSRLPHEVKNNNRDKSVYPSPLRPWVVGLARGLMVNSEGEHQEWPPGGSDLSFYLRRVITDSLEPVRKADFSQPSALDSSVLSEDAYNDDVGFWDDVEARLGFAIRHLPIGTEPAKEKWLDPTSIEALDFLFMDYKPPRPLRPLITKEILSKYQRMFNFLLRLMRVQSAVYALHRVARHSKGTLFSTSPSSRQLFEYFLFAAHGFVSALSSYVSHTAVGGNIDAFLAKVAAAETQSRDSPADSTCKYERSGPLIFEDVHALSEAHSKTLNDILSACLQRSSQHAYGDLLKSCLEVLLQFCTLVGNLVSGSIDENEAAQKLCALWVRWKGKVGVLAKALHKLGDKGVTPINVTGAFQVVYGGENGLEKPLPTAIGGVEALSDLLIRLDFSDWWKNLPLSK